jgi:hypothetical protein
MDPSCPLFLLPARVAIGSLGLEASKHLGRPDLEGNGSDPCRCGAPFIDFLLDRHGEIGRLGQPTVAEPGPKAGAGQRKQIGRDLPGDDPCVHCQGCWVREAEPTAFGEYRQEPDDFSRLGGGLESVKVGHGSGDPVGKFKE